MALESTRASVVGIHDDTYGQIYVPRIVFGDSRFPFTAGDTCRVRILTADGTGVAVLVLPPSVSLASIDVEIDLDDTDTDTDSDDEQ